MMTNNYHHVCPVEQAGGFDTWYRRWLQNPKFILGEFIKPGMTVMDVGCGPGYFSVPMAELVGDTGKVIAADLQQGMLDLVSEKLQNLDEETARRIVLHRCESTHIGVSDKLDFVLAFYMVHETPDKRAFLQDVFAALKYGGKMLVAELPLFHGRSFKQMLTIAEQVGYELEEGPGIFLAKTIVLVKRQATLRTEKST